MIVMKFGGTSMGLPENFATACRLVADRTSRRPVVVVSALAGVTNLLAEFALNPAVRLLHRGLGLDRESAAAARTSAKV